VTGAITISSPGADDATRLTAAPALTWAAYPSASTYDIKVYDAFGNSVFTGTTNKGAETIQYTGPLDHGMYYQFHVVAKNVGAVPISSTEDLRGEGREFSPKAMVTGLGG
jgi:hypothetical protein